ncbi:AlpA family transcriptional regulator [Pseudorhodoferax sp. Leaf267]|uniref:helix-turn-helix transcriptional regulator n=1 Tax=Pseudorhodoferax sp. Leaf267 TaxID=1736316 RepID=UPI0009E8D8E2|nr:AlpA family phage regulatory protein [Pseudorhodoferax sp. Leaf267]
MHQVRPETSTNDHLLRLPQIIGQRAISPEQARHNAANGQRGCRPRQAIAALIPVSRTTWLEGVKAGRYPQPVKIGLHAVAWRSSEVLALLAKPTEVSG